MSCHDRKEKYFAQLTNMALDEENAYAAIDVRDDHDLPGGIENTTAVWRKLHGEDVFTGVVRLPLPSLAWQAAGQACSMARLCDPAGPIDGPCRILAPGAFVALMETYDAA